jgi:hypothetical protein
MSCDKIGMENNGKGNLPVISLNTNTPVKMSGTVLTLKMEVIHSSEMFVYNIQDHTASQSKDHNHNLHEFLKDSHTM